MRVFVAALLVALVAAHERQHRTYPVRCFPGTHCWPDNEDLAYLDAHTTGSILQPKNTAYRSNILYTNERITKHPGLVLVALTEDDVVAGMKFARKFHLLVHVQGGNSRNFDHTGKMSTDGSFIIDISSLRGVSPTIITAINSNDPGSVTVGAGATWADVYSQVEGTGRVVVGTNPSDSVYDSTLTGGISVLSRSLGLVSDNLLSARVVLANGKLATLSAGGVVTTDHDGEPKTYTDASLFAAIRGGGYNWVVPVSFTFRLYFPPFQLASYSGSYNIFVDGQFLGRDALKFVLQQVGTLPTAWGGYIMVDGTPNPNPQNAGDKGAISLKLLHYGVWNQNAPSAGIQSLQNYVPTGVRQTPVISIVDNFQQYRSAVGEEDVFDSWPNKYVSSVLVSADLLTNNTKLDAFVDLMMGVVSTPTVDSNIRCIAKLLGGQVSARGAQSDAITQEFRDAIMSVTCGLTWRESLVTEDAFLKQAVASVQELRKYGMAVDPRYAAEDLADWRTAVFGAKYQSLLETKMKYDVDNFLWTYNHVASDFRLDCRYGRCHHK